MLSLMDRIGVDDGTYDFMLDGFNEEFGMFHAPMIARRPSHDDEIRDPIGPLGQRTTRRFTDHDKAHCAEIIDCKNSIGGVPV